MSEFVSQLRRTAGRRVFHKVSAFTTVLGGESRVLERAHFACSLVLRFKSLERVSKPNIPKGLSHRPPTARYPLMAVEDSPLLVAEAPKKSGRVVAVAAVAAALILATAVAGSTSVFRSGGAASNLAGGPSQNGRGRRLLESWQAVQRRIHSRGRLRQRCPASVPVNGVAAGLRPRISPPPGFAARHAQCVWRAPPRTPGASSPSRPCMLPFLPPRAFDKVVSFKPSRHHTTTEYA